MIETIYLLLNELIFCIQKEKVIEIIHLRLDAVSKLNNSWEIMGVRQLSTKLKSISVAMMSMSKGDIHV